MRGSKVIRDSSGKVSFEKIKDIFGINDGEKIRYYSELSKFVKEKEFSKKTIAGVLYAYLISKIRIASSLVKNKKTHFVVVDVDELYNEELVLEFCSIMFNAYGFVSFFEKSRTGRIHVYFPFFPAINYGDAVILGFLFSKLAKVFFGTERVEYFPNRHLGKVLMFGEEITAYNGKKYKLLKDDNERLSLFIKGEFISNLDKKISVNKANQFTKFKFENKTLFHLLALELKLIEDTGNKVYDSFEKKDETENSAIGLYTKEDFDSLLEKLESYYKRGHRHELIYWTSGLAATLGIPYAEFLSKINNLLEKDEEKSKRIKIIARAYERKRKSKPLYFYGLTYFDPKIAFLVPKSETSKNLKHAIAEEFLTKAMNSEFSPRKTYKKFLDEIISKINKFGNVFILGYNAMDKKGISKRDSSAYIKHLIGQGILRRVKVGFFIGKLGSKKNYGSVYYFASEASRVFIFGLGQMKQEVKKLLELFTYKFDFFAGKKLFAKKQAVAVNQQAPPETSSNEEKDLMDNVIYL